MSAIADGIALFDIVPCFTTPVAHLTSVVAPSVYGMVVNGDLSPASSLALEIGGLVYVVVNMAMDTSNGIGSGQTFRTPVHCKSFGLEGLLQSPNAMGDLNALSVVSTEVFDFALQGGIVFLLQCPVY